MHYMRYGFFPAFRNKIIWNIIINYNVIKNYALQHLSEV